MTTLSPAERSYIISGLSHPTAPTRLDGRTLLAPRAIDISYGDAPQASGSARVVIAGGTEVIAGIQLDVSDVDPGVKGKGREGWRSTVQVDITPQAYPAHKDQALQTLSTVYAALLSETFVPSIPPLPILPPSKYFVPHIHLSVLSASSGSVLTALVLALRGALADLQIPKTKVIGWEGGAGAGLQDGQGDLSGIKAAVRAGRSKGRGARVRGGDEWDLDMQSASGDGLERLQGRKELPVLVTLNLVPGSTAIFIDATPQEEEACPDRVHLFFSPLGKITGIKTEGTGGLEAARIKSLLQQGQHIAAELVSSLNTLIPA